jgi:methylated-DNA-[protein]-cysteine S-methyltransferase
MHASETWPPPSLANSTSMITCATSQTTTMRMRGPRAGSSATAPAGPGLGRSAAREWQQSRRIAGPMTKSCGLLTDEIPSAIGVLVVVVRDGRLCALDYEDCRRRMLASLESRYGVIELRRSADPFGVSAKVRAYLEGDLVALDAIPVETGGTPFQQRMWAALRRISPGTTVSYAELAVELGRPSGARAVGATNGRNPIAIVVPCHRVVGTDGSLTGYAGGLWRKRWLLTHEGAAAATGEPASGARTI